MVEEINGRLFVSFFFLSGVVFICRILWKEKVITRVKCLVTLKQLGHTNDSFNVKCLFHSLCKFYILMTLSADEI